MPVITDFERRRLNSMRADLTDEQLQSLDRLNSQAMVADARHLYMNLKDSGFRPEDDPEGFVMAAARVKGFGGVTMPRETAQEQFEAQKNKALWGTVLLGGPVDKTRVHDFSDWDHFALDWYKKPMDPLEAAQEEWQTLKQLYDPAEQEVLEFVGKPEKEQKAQAVESANERQGTKRVLSGILHAMFGGAPTPELAKEERETFKDVDESDEGAVKQAVEDETQRLANESTMMAFDQARQVMTPADLRVAYSIAGADKPEEVWAYHEKHLEGVSKERFDAIVAASWAAEPEKMADFWERQGSTFDMVKRTWQQAGRFAGKLGRSFMALTDEERLVLRQVEKQVPDAFDEAGNLVPEHEKAVRKVINDMEWIAGEMTPELEQHFVDNLGKVRQREQQRERTLALKYGVRKATDFKRFSSLPDWQEGLLNIESISWDMVSRALLTTIPVVGQAAAIGVTGASFQQRLSEQLIFEHDVDPLHAELIAGVAMGPYTASEYLGLKYMNPLNWSKLGKVADTGFRLMTAAKQPSFIQTHMFYFKQYLGRAMVREVKEEYVQAGIEYAAEETARLWFNAQGMSFEGNIAKMWAEAVDATKYMPFVTLFGGGIMGAAQGRFVPPEFKQAMHDRLVPSKAWKNAQGARQEFNRLQEEGGFERGRFAKELKDLVRRADTAAEKPNMDPRALAELEDDVNAAIDGAEYAGNRKEVLSGIRLEIEADEVVNGLVGEEAAIFRDQLDRQLGEADETSVLTSPKLSLIESMMDSYGGRLGVTLRPVKTQEEALSDPVIRAKYEANGGKGKIKAVLLPNREMVVVEENISNAADGLEQVAHEMFGHRGLDLNPKAGNLFEELKKQLNLDFIRSELPAFYRTQSDEAVLNEYLTRQVAKAARGQELGGEQSSNVWKTFQQWMGRELGITPDAAMRAADVARLAKDVLAFSKGYNAAYPDGTTVKFNRRDYSRKGGQWVNDKGQAVKDAGLVAELEAVADEQIQKKEATASKERKKQVEQEIQTLIDGDPILSMVNQEGGIAMPKLKPGESHTDENAAIPKRWRATKRSRGLSLDEMTDQVAGLRGEEANYSTSDMREYLIAADEKFERMLSGELTTKYTEDTEGNIPILGKISDPGFDALFSVAARSLDLESMPETMNEVHTATSLSWLKKTPGYKTAKEQGDVDAAAQVVLKQVDKLDLDVLRSSGAQIIVGVDSFENGGKNAIPYVLKHELSDRLNLPVAEIAVIDKAGSNTGASPLERMGAEYRYDVDLAVKGKKVLLVDDTYTSGETVLMVADAVNEAGGEVVSVAALAFSQAGKGIKATKEQTAKLLDILGMDAAQFDHEFGFQPTQFTGAQVRRLTDLNKSKDKSGSIRKFIRSLPAVQRQSARRSGQSQSVKFSVAAGVAAGVDLYHEAEQNNLSDESGQGAAPADGGGIRRIFPGLSGKDTVTGRGPQQLGTVQGFERTEKIVDTGFTRIYIGNWSANSEKQSPLFETLTWNGVDAWVRQPMSSTQEAAHDIAGHAHNYFLWNKRNDQVQAHEGLFYKTELLPDEPKPRASDKRRAEARIEAFGDSDVRQAHQNELRFSVEQQADVYQETAVHVAGRIVKGDFQFRQITRGKRKGQMVERPEKDQLAEVEQLLKAQGGSGKLAGEILAAAREIALNVSREKDQLVNDRLLSKAIRDEGIRQQFRSMVRRANEKGREGGEYDALARAHVEERIRREAEMLARTMPGLMIDELEETYGVQVRDLLDLIELQEKAEKLSDKKQKPPVVEDLDAGSPLMEGMTPEEREIYKTPADVFLFRIKSAVVRDLLKQGAIDDVGSIQKKMRSPIARKHYAETLKHVLLKTSAELNYGFSRDVIERGIRGLDDASLLSTIDRRAERLIERMFDERVRETKEELYRRAKTELDGFKGKVKSRVQDVNRKVTGRIEKLFNHARKALVMPPEASEKKLMALQDKVQLLAGRAYQGDPDAQAEFDDALDELNAYSRFAGFKFKTTAQMAEQLEWLNKTMADEMAAQEELREKLRKETRGMLDKILPTLPNRKKGRPGSAYFSQFLEQKLERIAHFGADGERQAAQKVLKDLAFDLARANFRKHQGVAEDNRAFGAALAEIYGVTGSKVLTPTRIQQVLHDLSRLRDEYERFSMNGVRLSKAHLLQIAGTLAQEDIRAGAKVQLELRALVEGKEGTAEEIAKSLWQDEDSAIKYTTTGGHGLTAGVLEHFVKTIQDGAHMSKRLEMLPKIMEQLTVEDQRLLGWFREYYRRNRPALSEVNKRVTGLQIVPPDVNYIPIKRDIEKGLKGVNVAMPVVPPSLSLRTFNARDIDETASIVDLYMQRLESNQNYVHFAELHQRVALLFNNPQMLKAMRNTHGKKFVDELLEHLRDTISAQPITGGGFDWAKHLTNFFAATRLGFNVSLMPRQVTSMPAFAMYVNTGDFLKYSGSAFSADGIKAMKTILASQHAQTRLRVGNTQMLNQMLSEMDPKGKAIGVAEVYQRLGTLPTKIGDIIPTLIFGSGYYRAMLQDASRQGMRTEEAHEWAMDQLWRLVEMSQQSGLMVNLARWQRSGGAGWKLIGQFISTPQQFASKQFHDIMDLAAAVEVEGWNSERARKAGVQVGKSVGIGGFLLAALYGGMKILWNAWLGDEPDEDTWKRFIADIISGPFSGIVIFGTLAEAGISGALTGERGWRNTLVPLAGLVDDFQNTGALLYHLLNDPEKAIGDLDALLRSNQAIYRDVSKAWKNYAD